VFRRLLLDNDILDYISLNKFELTINRTKLSKKWIFSVIFFPDNSFIDSPTICGYRLYECINTNNELPIYLNSTSRDLNIMMYGISKDTYDYLFNRLKHYAEFSRLFYSNKNLITRSQYDTSYYNKLFFEYFNSDYSLFNLFYGRKLISNNNYIYRVINQRVYYKVFNKYAFYLRKYLNDFFIMIFSYFLKCDILLRIFLCCFIKDLRGQNRRFIELREMYYYNVKRWRVNNYIIDIFTYSSLYNKKLRNKFKLLGYFRFVDYYIGNTNSLYIDDVSFIVSQFKEKLLARVSFFNMYVRPYNFKIIGSLVYDNYNDLGSRLYLFKNVFSYRGNFRILKWINSISISFYFYMHLNFNYLIHYKYNLYCIMSNLKYLHYYSTLLCNKSYYWCLDNFYIYFDIASCILENKFWKYYTFWDGLDEHTLWGWFGRIRKKRKIKLSKGNLLSIRIRYKSILFVLINFLLFDFSSDNYIIYNYYYVYGNYYYIFQQDFRGLMIDNENIFNHSMYLKNMV
jgi:hypothetical protein